MTRAATTINPGACAGGGEGMRLDPSEAVGQGPLPPPRYRGGNQVTEPAGDKPQCLQEITRKGRKFLMTRSLHASSLETTVCKNSPPMSPLAVPGGLTLLQSLVYPWTTHILQCGPVTRHNFPTPRTIQKANHLDSHSRCHDVGHKTQEEGFSRFL